MPYSINFPLILSLLGVFLFGDRFCFSWRIGDDNVLALMLVGRCIEIVVRVGCEELRLDVAAFVDFRVVMLVEWAVGPGMMYREELIRRIVGIIIRVILSRVEMAIAFLQKMRVLGWEDVLYVYFLLFHL